MVAKERGFFGLTRACGEAFLKPAARPIGAVLIP